MKQCPECDRHLFGEEPACPFCGAEQHSTPAPLATGPTTGPVGSMLASVTLALGLCTMACGPTVNVETDASSSSDDGPASTTTTTTTTSTTVAMTTVGTTAADDSSTTSIDTSSSSDDADDNPCAFYACRPDTGNPSECDLYTQDCPDGEKCMPWASTGGAWNATHCVPVVDDPGAAGDPCTVQDDLDDCGVGLMCWIHDHMNDQGTCIEQCSGSEEAPTCSQPGQVCIITNDGYAQFCLDACDPLLGDCPETTGCYGVGDPTEFACFWTYEPGVYGDPCMYVNDCDPGWQCQTAALFPACASSACCTPFCDVTLAEPCPEAELGVTCVPWFEEGMAPPGHEDVGICVLPPA